MTSNMTPNNLSRFCLLLLPLLLLWSGFQSAFAQPQLSNLSTRMQLQAVPLGDYAAAGFIITGTGGTSKKVVLRALGPTLSLPIPMVGPPPPFVPALNDPLLSLAGCGSCLFTTNDDWYLPPAAGASYSGLVPPFPPPFSTESAIVADLSSGTYTATIQRNTPAAILGFALIELYDRDLPTGKLVNLSTRAFVGTDDARVIAGFILTGSGSERIVVRGLGPSLAAFNIPMLLVDPTIELRNANGGLLLDNDNWEDDPAQAAQLSALGLGPTNSRESGLIMSLMAGPYTALLAGKGNTIGNGTVEIYDVGP